MMHATMMESGQLEHRAVAERRGARSVFSSEIVVAAVEREDGSRPHLDLLSVLPVVQRWRDAVISQSNDMPERVRELLSGHTVQGAPLEGPHLVFLPLAMVGRAHADGRLLGMALALPADIPAAERELAVQALGRVRRLALGKLGAWRVAIECASSRVSDLAREGWTAHPEGATQWATVTPVVFDRHPKGRSGGVQREEVVAMIARGCTRIGLPEPRAVIVTDVSVHFGVPPTFAFPRLRRKDGSERRHAHVVLVFGEPVVGPVVIGAGRYRGYGVCRATGGRVTRCR